MKSFLLTIAAVQILHCSGIPSPKEALRVSVIKLNEITETTNLCGITRRRVKDIYRTGKLSYNVDLTFLVKETVCSKNSGLEFDDPNCYFRTKKTAVKGFCKSHVEYFADEVVDIDVECRGLKIFDSKSGSLESSENSIEMKTKRTFSPKVYKRVKQIKRLVASGGFKSPIIKDREWVEDSPLRREDIDSHLKSTLMDSLVSRSYWFWSLNGTALLQLYFVSLYCSLCGSVGVCGWALERDVRLLGIGNSGKPTSGR
ncbi:secreted phosphoprotein 24-like [Heterodontus francisci]|uniref:secreted phosphoprotein 24-like n=1 Tax=Heterodontus francisci TaxID=7792 RepID=UPI00355BB0E2